jgi:hypothetical protein
MNRPLESINLTITKATLIKGGGRWACVASDTEQDKAMERTSLELFHNWIDRIKTGKAESYLPAPRWPFLGLSHYPGLDGKGEGGLTDKAYIDGNRFKASGIFNQNPLGESLSSAIVTERALIKKGEFEGNPIRISAGWYDLSHKHVNSGHVFVRKSLMDKCPVCESDGAKAQADKIYIDGQLDHFACTRVPMNVRTEIAPESEVMKSMSKKVTRLEDAKSIVSEEIAEDINNEAVSIGKSETEDELPEAMVVRSDEDEAAPDTEKAKGKKKTPPSFEADDTADEEEVEDGDEEMEASKKPPKRKKEPMKADTDDDNSESPEVEKMGQATEHPGPFGGATSMKDAMDYIESAEKLDKVYSRLSVFQTVVSNIQRNPTLDATQKVKAMGAAVNDLAGQISVVKAAIEDSYLMEDVNNFDDDWEGEPDQTKSIYESLYEAEPAPQEVNIMPDQTETLSYDAQIQAIKANTALTPDQKREKYQELLEAQAQAFKSDVEATELAQGGASTKQINALTEAVTAIAKSQADLTNQIALLAQKSATPQPIEVNGLPVQKSMTAQPPVQNGVAQAAPNSFQEFINKSVGL